MGAFSHGIADAIRRMGDAQAQGALQKGAVYGNLAHDLGQAPMQYLAIDRGLHENQYRQTMQAAQEKKLKDDQEFEALINQTPPGPERLKVSLEFWQGRDPEKYHALVAGAYQAATQAVGAQQGRPGEPKLTPDPVSGEPTQIDQQTAHAPVQFPGAYGQEPFSVTPQTDTQVQAITNQQSGLKAFIDAKMKAKGTIEGEAGKPQSWAPDTILKLPGQEAFQLPGRQQKDPAPSVYGDFRSGDPEKQKTAEAFSKIKSNPEMEALNLALKQKQLDKPDAGAAGSAGRLDKSYQYNATQLANLGKAVRDRSERLDRLRVSLDANSPQADSLIAPELLTAMAGGQGSGLRMNEAEISRIVGGRSQWESIKASLNKWQMDPSKALSITPAQRQQIKALVGTMSEKVNKKMQILDQAQQELIDSGDVVKHRQTVANAQKALTTIDSGADSSSAPKSDPLGLYK